MEQLFLLPLAGICIELSNPSIGVVELGFYSVDGGLMLIFELRHFRICLILSCLEASSLKIIPRLAHPGVQIQGRIAQDTYAATSYQMILQGAFRFFEVGRFIQICFSQQVDCPVGRPAGQISIVIIDINSRPGIEAFAQGEENRFPFLGMIDRCFIVIIFEMDTGDQACLEPPSSRY
jgi:hypothetical protein